MPTADLAVETRGLTRDFGGLRAVDSLSLRVEAGSLYGFLGRNGAGKSTTIKMLTGILAPTAGKVSLLGTDISDVAAAVAVRRRIGVVPEDLALFDLLTGDQLTRCLADKSALPQIAHRRKFKKFEQFSRSWHTED